MKVILAIIPALVLSACSSPSMHRAGQDHPANAEAVAGVSPRAHEHMPRSDTSATTPDVHDHSTHEPVRAAAPTAAGQTIYMCPMHPKVTSHNPEDRCPECGMKINQKVAPEAPK